MHWLEIVLPLAVFNAWFLWGVNWRRGWPVLAAGGWLPLVLTGGMAAYVWSKMLPGPLVLAEGLVISNMTWKLAIVGLLIGDLLFCGWLQNRLGWFPPEISLEPPTPGHGDEHGHHSDGHAGGH